MKNKIIYKINGTDVTAEEFETELQKRIDEYVPYSEYYPKKKDLRKVLAEEKEIIFNNYDKRYKDRLVITTRDSFLAVEEEILNICGIIEDSQYDPLDNDALQIAIALYKAGYRKTKEKK